MQVCPGEHSFGHEHPAIKRKVQQRHQFLSVGGRKIFGHCHQMLDVEVNRLADLVIRVEMNGSNVYEVFSDIRADIVA